MNKKTLFVLNKDIRQLFLDNIWVLIPNLALIFLWHIKFWNYSERLFWVYKQLYGNIYAFISK